MKFLYAIWLLLISMSCMAANVTINVDVTIANQEVTDISVSGPGVTNGRYIAESRQIEITDSHPDLAGTTVVTQQAQYFRDNSLFSALIRGQQSNRTETIRGKMIFSRITFPNGGVAYQNGFNSGCSLVNPVTGGEFSGGVFTIEAYADLAQNCTGKTRAFSHNGGVATLSNGSRRYVFDISPLVLSNTLPIDIYRASFTYNGIRALGIATPVSTFNLTIHNKSYFSGLTLGANIVDFNVNNHNESTGLRVSGQASTSFNLLGRFTELDRIRIDARSTNNFRLSGSGGSIPYNASIVYRGTTIPLVANGVKQNPIILEPNLISTTLSGSLAFDFSVQANQITNGVFNDTFTLMAELVL